jgi:hypothetical protein
VERRADASAFCDCGAERHGHLRGSASPVLRGILGINPQHYRSGCLGWRSKTSRSKPPITSPSKPRRGSAPPSDGLAPPRNRRKRAPALSIADDEAPPIQVGVSLVGRPGRREAAGGHRGLARHFLWKGLRITINGDAVTPFDPLYLHAAVRGRPHASSYAMAVRKATRWSRPTRDRSGVL